MFNFPIGIAFLHVGLDRNFRTKLDVIPIVTCVVIISAVQLGRVQLVELLEDECVEKLHFLAPFSSRITLNHAFVSAFVENSKNESRDQFYRIVYAQKLR